MPKHHVIILLLLILCLFSCSKKEKTTNQHPDQNIIRFEQKLFTLDFDTINDHIDYLNNKYADFFSLYNNHIIQIGSVDNELFPSYLQDFLTDHTMNLAYNEVVKKFTDFSSIEEQINQHLWNYQIQFPSKQIPAVYTCISGFNESIILGDSILAIALDKYLGRDCPFYQKLNWHQYQIKNMYKEKIPADCIYAMVLTDFPLPEDAKSLIDHMIYHGKILYLTKKITQAHDTLVLGFTEDELNFCKNFEERMWIFLIEQKLLFSTELMTIMQFTEDGPFTKYFGNNSPSKAANWIGMRIIQSYMKKNSDISLSGLMKDKDYSSILKKSGYNP